MRPAVGAILALVLLAPLTACDIHARPGSRTLFEAFRPPSPQEAVEMALDDANADRRYRGTMLLANAPWGGAGPYIPMYVDYVDDDEPNVRAAAVRALGNHGEPEHVPLIVARLEDPSEAVRLEAAVALQRLHNPVAIDPLLRRLSVDVEPNVDVRAEAAVALGQYASTKVLQRLIAALTDRNLRVLHASERSLTLLTGEDFGLDRRAWAQWARQVQDPFAGRRPYEYPVFQRDKRLLEYLPFVPPPPNETPDAPAGMPRDAR